MPGRPFSVPIGYAVALLAAVFAAMARVAPESARADQVYLAPFVGAVVLAAWFGGQWPALLAAGLGPLLSVLFRLDGPAAAEPDPPSALALGVYGLVSFAIARIGETHLRARQAAEARGDALQTTLACIGDGVITADAQGRVTFLNPVAAALTGWPAVEASGQPLTEVFRAVAEETRTPTADLVRQARVERRALSLAGHSVLLCRDGTECPIDASINPLFPVGGAPAGVVVIFRDVRARREAERKVRESERLYRAIGESIPFGVWVCAPDGRNLYASPSFLDLVGITQAQCSEFGWGDVLHPEDAARTIAAWKECVRTRGIWSIEHRFRGRDGGYHPILARGVPVEDEQGNLLFWAGINLDISDLKRAQEAARANEERLRQALHVARMVAWEWDLVRGAVHVSDNAATVFGARPDELDTEEKCFATVHADDLPRLRREADEAVAGKGRFVTPARLTRRDSGVEVWVEVHGGVVPPAAGEPPTRVSGVALDVSERQQAAEALRESEARFRNLADSAPVLIWVLGEGGCEFANRPTLEFLGVPFERIRGMGWVAYLYPDETVPYLEGYRRAVEGRQPFQGQFRLRRVDGTYCWMKSVGLPRYTPGGTFLGYVGCCIDINDVKQAEEALREADRRKDDFLATLAHELRNPLAPIRNSVAVLEARALPDPALREALAMIERQVQQMTLLIDDLLDISRITLNKLELRRQRVTLAAVLSNALEAIRPQFDRAGHHLSVEVPTEPLLLDADPVRLTQVFANLLINACKYTDPGGQVRLMARRQDDAVEVTLRDSGIGIAPEHLPRLFEKFSQVAPALERAQGGLGIGLALVRGLVEMHGGSVTGHSEGQGKGSWFVVRLPLLTEAAVVPLPPPLPLSNGEVAATAGPRRILVVDDNRDSAASLAMLLRLGGDEVETAHDGLEAVQLAERFRPEVILLDLGMPKLNGYDACRQIRGQDWGRGMVLIAQTGWGQEEDRRRSREAGFDGHLVKPVNARALRRLLAEVQASRQERRTS